MDDAEDASGAIRPDYLGAACATCGAPARSNCRTGSGLEWVGGYCPSRFRSALPKPSGIGWPTQKGEEVERGAR